MVYNNVGLVKYCKEALELPTVYCWGGVMRPLTEAYLKTLAEYYPARYDTARQAKLRQYIDKRYACDCIGLIKSYYWGGIGSPYYKDSTDKGTTGMLNAATEKGLLSTIPEIPGLAVTMTGHVGVYIGNGEVIECTLSRWGDGVVKTNLHTRGWTHWYKIPYIAYVEEQESSVTPDSAPVTQTSTAETNPLTSDTPVVLQVSKARINTNIISESKVPSGIQKTKLNPFEFKPK